MSTYFLSFYLIPQTRLSEIFVCSREFCVGIPQKKGRPTPLVFVSLPGACVFCSGRNVGVYVHAEQGVQVTFCIVLF